VVVGGHKEGCERNQYNEHKDKDMDPEKKAIRSFDEVKMLMIVDPKNGQEDKAQNIVIKL